MSGHLPLPALPPFAGEFEIHLTVAARGHGGDLARYAAERAWKYAYIVLDRGRTPAQPMLTLRAEGTLAAARGAADAAAAGLRGAGFPVLRTKVEAAPWADGVPAHDAEAVALGPHYYFEHHVKLVLDPGADTTGLAALADRHAAHLSRNARRTRADGRAERFVTQRCRRVGRDTAGRRLDELTAALDGLPCEIASVEREFVVYDSAESLDQGWIREHEGTA
ncbi:hypothetical protein [Streptomyces sp. XD-27]|uniref:hypothetical protein n=1 Tax=Streptomyces sp. XD-27 TaxID=3062779 RepID=UPI0026F41D0C|nr:hypothetical protein [Streptomyces sp. XD-27]WKX72261.1 hypothetical protein Q3Y56_22275 [Streptomyces sp. XD-27]